MASSELFQTLRKYVRGQASKYDIERSDSSVYRVVEHTTKGLTKISFEFKNDEELLKKLGVSDDDIYFVNAIFSPYSDWGFIDSSQVMEDFKEGYNIFYNFTEENIETLKFILKIIDPAYDYSEIGREESSNKRAAEVLLKIYPDEIDRILGDYYAEVESAASRKAEEVISEELIEVLTQNGFGISRKWDTVNITVGELIMLYLKTGKVWLTFKDLFESVFDSEDSNWNWSEDSYEWAYNSDFDKEAFNRDVSWQLDKIKDKVEDDETLPKFIEFYDRITKKFKVGVTYDLPKLKGVQFRIKDFDKETMKVSVVLRKGLKTTTKKVSEQDFYNLLYQPELFYSEFGSV